jgi:DNA modification methylase
MVKLPLGSCVLDPFCGGGTTLMQAKLSGFQSVGLDISPVSVFLSNTRVRRYDAGRLRLYLRKISGVGEDHGNIPDVAILHEAFSTATLRSIFALRDAIEALKCKEKDLLMLGLLRTVDVTSRCKKSGGFLRISDNRRVTPRGFRNEFVRLCERIVGESQHIPYSDAQAVAFLGDARKFPRAVAQRKYDAIFTSPPYLNRHDYTRIYALELLVGFTDTNKDLKSLRYHTLRSHVEAKQRYRTDGYEVHPLLTRKIRTLEKREMNNSKIIPTIEGYFEDIWLTLKEMYRVLKPGGAIGLVISNVRFAGIDIPVDIILAEMGGQVGLRVRSINILRYRGNSSQQMGRYKRQPSRESLIVWSRGKARKWLM